MNGGYEQKMLTEFEVRRRMEIIRASRLSPLRKARLLLRLGRCLNHQERSLTHAKAQIAQTSDLKANAGLRRMASTTAQMREDLRDAAWSALHDQEIFLS